MHHALIEESFIVTTERQGGLLPAPGLREERGRVFNGRDTLNSGCQEQTFDMINRGHALTFKIHQTVASPESFDLLKGQNVSFFLDFIQ